MIAFCIRLTHTDGYNSIRVMETIRRLLSYGLFAKAKQHGIMENRIKMQNY
jgi:hypothetical protein